MITEAFKLKHGLVSPTWRRFLEFAEQHPELAQPLDVPEIQCSYPVQAWPTFISAARRQEIAEAAVSVFALLRKIPQNVFGMDMARLSAFYGIDPEVMPHLLSEPNGIDGAVGRGDFMDSDAGFKCVEFNPYGNLGGLETEFICRGFRRSPAFSRFVEATGIEPRFDRLVLALFEHFIRDTRARKITRFVVNIAALVESEEIHYEANTRYFDEVYAEALKNVDAQVGGRIICCRRVDIEDRGGHLFVGDTRIHGVWELGSNDRSPENLFVAFKFGRISYYNSAFSGYLGEKRNLALLSQAAEQGLFDADDTRLIERYVPWSREVVDGEVGVGNQRRSLLAHLREQRDGLVLKKGFGMKGEQVFIGRMLSAGQWDEVIRTALDEGDWLAQEFLAPRAYLYQHGDQGVFPYHAVWGAFCYGSTYAGAYLRIVPETKQGPINSAQGAMTGLVFEA